MHTVRLEAVFPKQALLCARIMHVFEVYMITPESLVFSIDELDGMKASVVNSLDIPITAMSRLKKAIGTVATAQVTAATAVVVAKVYNATGAAAAVTAADAADLAAAAAVVDAADATEAAAAEALADAAGVMVAVRVAVAAGFANVSDLIENDVNEMMLLGEEFDDEQIQNGENVASDEVEVIEAPAQ